MSSLGGWQCKLLVRLYDAVMLAVLSNVIHDVSPCVLAGWRSS